jgi:hypothetical protein
MARTKATSKEIPGTKMTNLVPGEMIVDMGQKWVKYNPL